MNYSDYNDVEYRALNNETPNNPWNYNRNDYMGKPYMDQREQDLRGLMDAFPDPRIQKFLQRRLDNHLTEKYGYIPNDNARIGVYDSNDWTTASVGNRYMPPQNGMMNWRDYQAEQERLAEAERQKTAAYLGNSVEEDTYNYTFTPRSRRGYEDTPYYSGQETTVDPNYYYDDETFYYPGTTTPETPAPETPAPDANTKKGPFDLAFLSNAAAAKGVEGLDANEMSRLIAEIQNNPNGISDDDLASAIAFGEKLPYGRDFARTKMALLSAAEIQRKRNSDRMLAESKARNKNYIDKKNATNAKYQNDLEAKRKANQATFGVY